MENEKKSSASIFIALIIGILLGGALFFVYKNFIAKDTVVPATEVPVEETQPIKKVDEPVEVSFLESLKTSILDTFAVEGVPEVTTEKIQPEEPTIKEADKTVMKENTPLPEEPVMASGERLETLLDETPAPPEVTKKSSELEEMIEEPTRELKLPSTGPDPSMM